VARHIGSAILNFANLTDSWSVTSKTFYTVCTLPKNQLNFFGPIVECSFGSNFYDFRCSWFFFTKRMHFYKKSLQAFFISNPRFKPKISFSILSSQLQSFCGHKIGHLECTAAILCLPFWILQIWQRIRNQRPLKSLCTYFHKNCRFSRIFVHHFEFWKSDNEFVISAGVKLAPRYRKIKISFIVPFAPRIVLQFLIG